MSNKKIIIKREELYDKVWEKALIKVAADYGLTDNGLKKICNKMNVPIPYNGYWAKLKYHKDVFKTPLPNLKPGDQETYELEIKEKPTKEILEQYKKLIDLENLDENRIVVPEKVTRLHPLVQLLKEAFVTSKEGYRDSFLSVPHSRNFYLLVTQNTLKRAIIILNTLVVELEKRGFKIIVPKEEDNRLFNQVAFGDLIYEIELREISKTETREIENTYSRKKELEKFVVGSGILKIQIKIKGGWEQIVLISDGKKLKVEDHMNKLFIRFYQAINDEIIRKRNIELYWIKENARKKEQEQIEAERKHEQERTDNLLKLAEDWNRVKYISAFLDEIEFAMKERNLLSEEKKDWLRWARNKMNSMNPINRVVL